MININEVTLNACMIRGDYATINVKNNIRDFETGDLVYLTVKKTVNDEVLFQVEVDTFNVDGTCTIEILPETTADLEPAIYTYDITWVDGDGNPNTLINSCDMPEFVIKKGATNG
jgi:hypothetical protein